MCPVGLCWEPLTLFLTPGLWSLSARVSTVPWGHVPWDRAGQGGHQGAPEPGRWAAGTPASKVNCQPCPPISRTIRQSC